MSDTVVTVALVAFDVLVVAALVLTGQRARRRTEAGLRAVEAGESALDRLRLHWSCSQCGEHGDAVPALPPSRWHRHFR